MIDFPPSQAKKMKQLNHYRRSLMLKVMDGDQALAPVMFKWNFKEGVDHVLRHLISKGMTGKNLSNWIFTVYGSNFHEPFNYLMDQAGRECRPPSIIMHSTKI